MLSGAGRNARRSSTWSRSVLSRPYFVVLSWNSGSTQHLKINRGHSPFHPVGHTGILLQTAFRGCCQWVLDAACEAVEWLISHYGSTPSPSVVTRQNEIYLTSPSAEVS